MVPKAILKLKEKLIQDKSQESTKTSNLQELYDYFNTKECKSGTGGFNTAELKEICKTLKISTSGTKEELFERIKKYFNLYLLNQQYQSVSKSKIPTVESPSLSVR